MSNQFRCLQSMQTQLLSSSFFRNASTYITSVLVSSVLFTACNSGGATKKAEAIPAPKDYLELPKGSAVSAAEAQRINAAAEDWFNGCVRSGLNGGMIVAKNGNIVFEKYHGNLHYNGHDAITDSSTFHIASTSKTFTAMATLKLWQDSLLNIDDELSKYFPDFNYPGVTVRTLLNHRSGLPNYIYFMEKMGWPRNAIVTNKDIYNYLVQFKAQLDVARPNTHFTYCNTNFAMLALLIEKVSGKSYGEYLKTTFFKPLQMNHTFVYTHADSGKVTPSYDYRGKEIGFSNLDEVYGDKNIYSTPRDLLQWDRGLSSGLIFTGKTLEQAYAPYSNEKAGIRNYGLGWRMNNYPDGSKMIYHNGWWHGNNSAFVRLIADSATIIVLGNKFTTRIYHAHDLAGLFGNYGGIGDEEEAAEGSRQGRNDPALAPKPKPVVAKSARRTTARKTVKAKPIRKATTIKKSAPKPKKTVKKKH